MDPVKNKLVYTKSLNAKKKTDIVIVWCKVVA